MVSQRRTIVFSGSSQVAQCYRIHLPMQETQEMQVRSLNQEVPWKRKWQCTPVFLPGESHGPRSLPGYSPQGGKESDVTKHAHTTNQIFSIAFKVKFMTSGNSSCHLLSTFSVPWWFRRQRICLQCKKIPWRREWHPTLVFLPGESHGQRSLAGYSPWGHKESDTTERLTHTFSVPSFQLGALTFNLTSIMNL